MTHLTNYSDNMKIKLIFVIVGVLILRDGICQTKESIDTTVVEINLSYAIPQFHYTNTSIEDGDFLATSYFNEEKFEIRSAFFNYLADDLWVAVNSNGIIRLMAYYNKGAIIFIKLFDDKERISRFIQYDGEHIAYEEWYHEGNLTQFKRDAGEYYRVIALRKNLSKRMLMDISKESKSTLRTVYYNEDGSVKVE